MKKIIFYIPFIIFSIFYGVIAISDIGAISSIAFVWLALFFISGYILHKNTYWGSLFGTLPAIHLIYLGTKETGQIINEVPIGIIIFIFYIVCGYFVYKTTKSYNGAIN